MASALVHVMFVQYHLDDYESYESYLNGMRPNFRALACPLFVSPEHAPDDVDKQKHVHVFVDFGGRYSRSSILKKLHNAGIFPAHDYVEHWRKGWQNGSLYLVHRTYSSYMKEQFPPEVEPVVFNAPSDLWRRSIHDAYLETVAELIDSFHITNARTFRLTLRRYCPELEVKAFNDLYKWEKFFYPPDGED